MRGEAIPPREATMLYQAGVVRDAVDWWNLMAISTSLNESARFSLRVGRWSLAESLDLTAARRWLEDFDVVVVRYPASQRQLAAPLAMLEDYVLVPADHLCYWEWTASRMLEVPEPVGFSTRQLIDTDDLGSLVIDVFSDYGNHYQANPLFPDALVAEGYGEWVDSMVASGDATCTILEGDGRIHGFGVIDWTTDVPDVRLAGMASASQGQGMYAWILRSLMAEASASGHVKIEISTQSDNINVMRAWARLGLLPVRTIATQHLVRRQLLQDLNRT